MCARKEKQKKEKRDRLGDDKAEEPRLGARTTKPGNQRSNRIHTVTSQGDVCLIGIEVERQILDFDLEIVDWLARLRICDCPM